MRQDTPAKIIRHARRQYDRGMWADALLAYTSLDESELAAEDSETAGICAFLTGDEDASFQYRERAFRQWTEQDAQERAALCAFWIGFELIHRGEAGRASGWLSRARRCIEENGLDSVVSAYFMVPAGLQALGEGRAEEACSIFSSMAEAAKRFDDPDLAAIAELGMGRGLIDIGDAEDGIRRFDELMVSLPGQVMSPVVLGIVYCAVIEHCHDLYDVDRAREWTNVLNQWCDSHRELVPYRGQCLIHRSEMLQFEGDWNEALEEAHLARERLTAPPGDPAAGAAMYQVAEIHRLRGDYEQAEENYRAASSFGKPPQPGLALMRSEQGETELAVGSIRAALAETHGPLWRIRILLGAVEVFLAAGDADSAHEACQELSAVAGTIDAPVLKARLLSARGAVLLENEEPVEALRHLREAESLLLQYPSGFERAELKVLTGRCLLRLGDADTAMVELDSARETFRRLEAHPRLEALERLLADNSRTHSADAVPGDLTPRETEVIRLVAAGMTNRQIAERLVISEKTVARHMSNIFVRLDISSRAAATAYAFQNGLAGRGPA